MCVSSLDLHGLLRSQSLLLETHIVLTRHPIYLILRRGSSPEVVSEVVEEIAQVDFFFILNFILLLFISEAHKVDQRIALGVSVIDSFTAEIVD